MSKLLVAYFSKSGITKAAAEKTQETVETKAVEVKTETAPETTGDQPQA